MDLGADAFLGKPFNYLELQSIVRNLLHLKEGEKEIERLNLFLTESVLKRYLPPTLVSEIIAGEISMDKPAEMRDVTVLFSDLCSFTKTSENLGPTMIAALLNEYLTVMNDIIFDCGGTIDKFIGDAIMVMFGAPKDMSKEDQATRSVECAKRMQEAMGLISKAWELRQVGNFQMRIGIHQGPAVVGNFGSDKRSDYTCIGPTVNLASRIESACEPGEVFISGGLNALLSEEQTEVVGDFELKGVSNQTRLYKVRRD
jgi:class 3 adenylate cyclase